VNGETADLRPQSQSLTFPPGQGGLNTLRLELTFSTPLPAQTDQFDITYRDSNYLDRAGWQEIVVQPAEDITLLAASVPAESLSQELRQYPDDYLDQPVKVQEASFQFLPVAGASTEQTTRTNPLAAAINAEDGNLLAQEQLAGLINIPEGPGPLLVAILLAFILGALHALSPGHGKTIVGAYLVGSRGTARHALFLGFTTTITHTAGVFAFGLLVLFASQFILPERLYPWLGVMSGLLVVGIGFSLFRGRLAGFRHAYAHVRRQTHDHHHDHEGHSHDDHDHDGHNHDGHNHSHGPGGHSHLPQADEDGRISWRSLLALGISGGLLPCPSALVLLLSAIALQRVGLGLFLILIFSLGLAGVLTAIGLAFVYAGRLLEKAPRAERFGRLAPLLPVFSALFVTLAGAAITTQAILQTGILS
jgi:ABC-type nickel/cobalt efflux system permease component RcnA